MLVKVSGGYCGSFGLFDESTMSIRAKRSGDPPFELDDSLAKAHLESGVLEKAGTGVSVSAVPAEWNDLKARAKELGINPVGKSKAVLGDLVAKAESASSGESGPDLDSSDLVED